MSNISIEQVRQLAVLSKLSLSDSELKSFTLELDHILGFIKQLQSIDTNGVEVTSQVTGLANVRRSDEVDDYHVDSPQLMESVPDRVDDFIKVKRIL